VTLGTETELNPVAGDHAYVPAPAAVSKTELPAQIAGGEDGVIVTTGLGFRLTVMTLENAVSWLLQVVFDISLHETTSLLLRLDVVKLLLFVPTGILLTSH